MLITFITWVTTLQKCYGNGGCSSLHCIIDYCIIIVLLLKQILPMASLEKNAGVLD